MNIIMLLKTVPAVGIAVYALSKSFPTRSTKAPAPRVMSEAIPSEIRGVVHDVMRDARHLYALIDTGTEWHWVGAREGEPSVGAVVSCQPHRFVRHVESSQLRMVLEGVYYADRFDIV